MRLEEINKKINGKLFINGEWRSGSNGNIINVVNPSTGDVISSVADASLDDAVEAVISADKASHIWSSTAPRVRGEILRKCYELMVAEKDFFAYLISYENGKSLQDAYAEVSYAAEFFRWFSEEAVRINGDIGLAPSGNSKIIVTYKPVGVSVLVTPWNFPAAMATRKIAPALAAGCTCVLKPATETPLTAYAIADLLSRAGVPDGVVNVITTKNSGITVKKMLEMSCVKKLSFTGSTEIGKVLLRNASESVIKCSMELGGNAPFIVFEDADIEEAIKGLMVAKMRNGGQACTAANRIYVHESILDVFSDKLCRAMSQLTVGDGYAESTDCGPLVNASSLEKIDNLVQDAVAKGAKVLLGGKKIERSGYFYEPTVIVDVSSDAAILKEEIFGPVAPIYTFSTDEEVVQRANETDYGLVAYLYTRDLARGLNISEKLDSGMIALNRGIVSDPAAPFGGVKESGLGREGGHHGILEFMEVKYTSVSW